MAFVNYNNKEITAKIVYYGPALSGKTSCIRYIYNDNQVGNKGKLITLDTDGDRTLFFDFLPLEIGKVGNFAIKIQLYTVPGQVAYDTTRKLVLQGADGIVFVADSQVVMREQNVDSFQNLKKNLKLNNLQFSDIPVIFHYNKRDLRETLPVDLLNRDLNPDNRPFFPTVAPTGENVLEGLHSIVKLVMIHLKNKLSVFQKDKTVMFSREELTSATAKEGPEEPFEPFAPPPLDKEETEEEEIFELSAPIPEAPPSLPAEEDVFNLGEEIAAPSAPEEFVVPEISYSNEDSSIQSKVQLDDYRTMTPPPAKPKSPPPANPPTIEIAPQTVEIPLTIEVPAGKEDISLNILLKVKLKRT